MLTKQNTTQLPPIGSHPPHDHEISHDYGKAIGFVAGGIGDQIYHLTQLRALAGASKDGRIDIACIHPGPIRKLLTGTSWVGEIIDARPFRRYRPGLRGTDAIRTLKNGHYDSAFFMHRSTSFKLAAAAAGIRTRIGLRGSWLDWWLLHHRLHLSAGGTRRSLWGHRPFIAAIDDYILRMGIELDGDTPTITPLKDAESKAKQLQRNNKPLIIVNLFAMDAARRWPIANAIEVIADLAANTKASFLLNAGPDAAAYHRDMMAAWHEIVAKNPALEPDQLRDCLTLSPSMEKDVALYHLADYYIGVDSFTANLALNCNLPALILFAKTGDILRYRSRVAAIAAPIEGQIGSIDTGAIIAAFTTLSQTPAGQAEPV